ncbi:transglutaminase-like cysteine peptidase [Mesorhizobium sp. VK4C]|uniref:transglutaminase-like cysteine peptidase n=1 Tax=Mesorhizobium captivum TaxID=3072319 RepID=UPI002A23F3F0|nr:transglutaminase-like cysteine peptidase [Mesorhizobium sp. VK4C]MDX8498703.1 transglutaminase-like cysteine peptidase [Mesorhizobium sp. VK4C]
MKRDVALIAFLLSVACPFAAQAGTTMETRGKGFAPPAFYSFCSRQPSLCSTAGGTKVVTLRSGLSAQLKQVNRSVNSRITELSDRAVVGKDDDWRVPTVSGDCEDIAILKKLELMKRGWPASALLLTVASYHGEGHTVLTVRTNEGDLVLDNLTNSVRDWSSTPYSYFARQAQGNGRRWERIGGAKPVGTTATGT